MDPRLRRGFESNRYPLADGLPPPPVGSERGTSKAKLEFLEAYYETNVALSQLLDLQSAGESRTAPRYVRSVENLRLALARRNSVEERYRPVGFWAEPEYEGSFVTNLRFTHPPKVGGGGGHRYTTEIGLS